MPRKRVESKNRIRLFQVGLRDEQINWIDNHPNIQIHKFFRDQLDKFIKLKTKLEEVTNEAII